MTKPSSINKIEQLTNTLESFVESKDLFILMIDLCDSTALKQFCINNSLPDAFWIMRQKTFLARTAIIIGQYKGTIVKTIGDEIMAIFENNIDAKKIIQCCTEVFQNFEGLEIYNKGNFKIYSKASIDFGNCVNGDILDNLQYDPIGRCVDRCARISKFVNRNEIILSEEFFKKLRLRTKKILGYEKIILNEKLKGLGKNKFYKLISG